MFSILTQWKNSTGLSLGITNEFFDSNGISTALSNVVTNSDLGVHSALLTSNILYSNGIFVSPLTIIDGNCSGVFFSLITGSTFEDYNMYNGLVDP